MTDKNKLHEYNTTKYILHKNNYNPNILDETITSINAKQHVRHDNQNRNNNTKMGHFHIHRKTNHIYHKTIQKYKCQNCIQNTKHHRTNFIMQQQPKPKRTLKKIWYLPINMPQL